VVSFQVRDIVSPFGLLRDNIPLPGPVVTAMGNSITELQSAFAPLIVAAPTSLAFTTTQGQGFGTPQIITVTNSGVYGSLLSPSVTTSADYLQATPANMGGIAFGASGMTNVSVDGTDLLALNSPYTATVTIQDVNATNNPQTIPVTITVLPQATITLSPTALSFNGIAFSNPPVPIPAQTFQVQNTGPAGSILNFQVQKLIGLSPWLTSFTPSSGTIASSGAVNVSVAVSTSCNLQPGTYTETLRVSGFSSNSYQDLSVTLTVT
jgi:hypothetical protein